MQRFAFFNLLALFPLLMLSPEMGGVNVCNRFFSALLTAFCLRQRLRVIRWLRSEISAMHFTFFSVRLVCHRFLSFSLVSSAFLSRSRCRYSRCISARVFFGVFISN